MPKWHFNVDIDRSVDQRKWILKEDGEGSQDSNLTLWPSDQSERGVGRFGASAPCQSQGCWMSGYYAARWIATRVTGRYKNCPILDKSSQNYSQNMKTHIANPK